jgi:hypothetical protein
MKFSHEMKHKTIFFRAFVFCVVMATSFAQPNDVRAIQRIPPSTQWSTETALDKYGFAYKTPANTQIVDIRDTATQKSFFINDQNKNFIFAVSLSLDIDEKSFEEYDARTIGNGLGGGRPDRVSKLTKIKFAGYRALKFEWRDWVSRLQPFPEAKTAGTLIFVEVKPKQYYALVGVGKDDNTKTGWRKLGCVLFNTFLKHVRLYTPK